MIATSRTVANSSFGTQIQVRQAPAVFEAHPTWSRTTRMLHIFFWIEHACKMGTQLRGNWGHVFSISCRFNTTPLTNGGQHNWGWVWRSSKMPNISKIIAGSGDTFGEALRITWLVDLQQDEEPLTGVVFEVEFIKAHSAARNYLRIGVLWVVIACVVETLCGSGMMAAACLYSSILGFWTCSRRRRLHVTGGRTWTVATGSGESQ